MSKPRLPAFDPADIAESNATSYPEKFRAANSDRWNRRLGNHVGLTNFGVNLTRIESRPLRRGMGQYMFFLDLEGSLASAAVADAVEELRSHAGVVRVLGSFAVAAA